jgi:hypothetical protein
VKSVLLVVLAQTAASWYGAGFIWTMQILNYPLLRHIAEPGFAAYETAHNQRFAAVVAPGVLVVLITTVLLFVMRPSPLPIAAPICATVLFVVIIASTVLWQAPAHGRLATGLDTSVHAMLVRTNWLRTIAWTALGLLDTWMVYVLFEAVRQTER